MMATEISQLRRKRTLKRNTISNRTLVEVNKLFSDKESDADEVEADLEVRLECLHDAADLFKTLDPRIADLIEDDEEAMKDEDETAVCNMKIKTAIKRIEKFLSKQKDIGFNSQFMLQSANNNFARHVEFDDSTGLQNGLPNGESNSVKEQPLGHGSNLGVKLPKISIDQFSGDITKWKSFIDTFEAAVHSKEYLTNIEKFSYLRGYLSGSALECIEGFPLSHDNYEHAMGLLKERL